jgi:hypothetical protein
MYTFHVLAEVRVPFGYCYPPCAVPTRFFRRGDRIEIIKPSNNRGYCIRHIHKENGRTYPVFIEIPIEKVSIIRDLSCTMQE